MTRTFNTNSNRDIFIGSDGNLSMATGIQGVLKACETACYAQLGEMVLATGLGIPNFQAIWIGVPNYPLYESYLRNTILAVPGVVSIKSLDITVKSNVLTYVATIVTQYGPGIATGGVTQGN